MSKTRKKYRMSYYSRNKVKLRKLSKFGEILWQNKNLTMKEKARRFEKYRKKLKLRL